MKIVESKKSRVWFCSDSHYRHSNICSATSNWPAGAKTRNFPSLESMDDAIVESINSRVGEDDHLIHLGDWAFGGFEAVKEFRDRINCKNVYLILGNHDHHIDRDKEGIRSLFKHVSKYEYITITREAPKGEKVVKIRMVLCHFPIASWHDMNQGVIHLHGHVHFSPEQKLSPGKMMDVGFDGSEEFRPYSLDEILDIMEDRPVCSLFNNDHHLEER
jgi:calcineurin-like phosphoesterase family protein